MSQGMEDSQPAANSYQIDLPSFSGPLDLLLHLVQKDQVNIYDIPIARVTQQYLDYLSAMRELDVNVASEFLVMAATLIQIKARLLLPKPAALEGGEEEEEDPRAALVRQLIEYRRYKESAALLAQMFAHQNRLFARVPSEEDSATQQVLFEGGDLAALTAAFTDLLAASTEETETARPLHIDRINVEEKMLAISQLLRTRKYLIFKDLFTSEPTRDEVIATFLALLEMVKLGMLAVRQTASLGRIELFAGPTLFSSTDGEVLEN
jgi:segregation and condensation protein A